MSDRDRRKQDVSLFHRPWYETGAAIYNAQDATKSPTCYINLVHSTRLPKRQVSSKSGQHCILVFVTSRRSSLHTLVMVEVK